MFKILAPFLGKILWKIYVINDPLDILKIKLWNLELKN